MLLGYSLTDLLHQWVVCARLGHFLSTYIQSLSFLWTCIKSLLRSKVVGQASSRGVVLLAALWPRLLSTFIKRPEQEPLHSCTTLTCTFAQVFESYISHNMNAIHCNQIRRIFILILEISTTYSWWGRISHQSVHRGNLTWCNHTLSYVMCLKRSVSGKKCNIDHNGKLLNSTIAPRRQIRGNFHTTYWRPRYKLAIAIAR